MKTILALLLSGMTALGVDVYITNITIQTTCDTNFLVLGMTNINAPTRLINGSLILNSVAVPAITGATNNVVAGPLTTGTNNLLKTVTNVVGVLPAPLATNLVNSAKTTNLCNYVSTYLGGLTTGNVIGTSTETQDLIVSGTVPITDVATTNNPILVGPVTLGFTNNGPAVFTNGNVGIGTNNPQAALHVFAGPGVGPNVAQFGSASYGSAGGTNVASIGTNGTLTTASSINAGGNIAASWWLGSADTFGVRLTPTGSKIMNPTNGTIKLGDNSATQSGVSNGATLLLDPVQSFPFPTSSKGVLTNNQWGIGNTNGTLTFMTADSTGTARNDAMVINSSGMVGHGTNNPQAALHVRPPINTNQYSLRIDLPAGTASTTLDTNGTFTVAAFTSLGNLVGGASSLIAFSGRSRLTGPDTNSMELWNSAKSIAGDLKLGYLYASNAVVCVPVATGPANITNGLMAIWNSNGVCDYIRSGPVGYTTNKDVLLNTH